MDRFCEVVTAPGAGEVVGAGLDLVRLDRARRLLAAHRQALADRVLHPGERTAVLEGPRAAEALALALAGKEAFFKALGHGVTGRFDWPQVEVRAGAVPALRPCGAALEAIERRGVTRLLFNVGEVADLRYVFTIFWRDRHEH
jgi:phosphopantetheinyl transferase (holo-ACP synthase)